MKWLNSTVAQTWDAVLPVAALAELAGAAADSHSHTLAAGAAAARTVAAARASSSASAAQPAFAG